MNRFSAKAVWFGSRKMQVTVDGDRVHVDLSTNSMTDELQAELEWVLSHFVSMETERAYEIVVDSTFSRETISAGRVVSRTYEPRP